MLSDVFFCIEFHFSDAIVNSVHRNYVPSFWMSRKSISTISVALFGITIDYGFSQNARQMHQCE